MKFHAHVFGALSFLIITAISTKQDSKRQLSDDNVALRNGSESEKVSILIQNAITDGIFYNQTEWKRKKNSYPHFQDLHKINDTVNNSPGNEGTRHPNSYTPDPRFCNGKSVCDGVPDYPLKLINDIIQRQDITFSPINDKLPETIIGRVATELKDNFRNLCDSKIELIEPQQGETLGGEWVYIVNVDTRFKQNIAVEYCSNEKLFCNVEDENFGYQMYCVQKYIYRRLLTLHPGGQTLTSDIIKVPSSCCCHFQFLDFFSRNRMDTKKGISKSN